MKQNLLKTMLVMAGIVAGSMGAWAQTVLFERGTSAAPWTEEDLADFKASTGTLELSDYGAKIATTNSAVEVSKDINPQNGTILNVEATWLGMSNVGRSMTTGTASYFRFGNIYILENDQDKNSPSAYSLSPFSATNYTNFTGPSGVRNYDPATRPFYIIKMEINTATNNLNYLKVYSSTDESRELLSLLNQPLNNVDYKTIAFGFAKGARMSTSQVEILKSIKVTETVQKVSTAKYTVKYVDDNNNEIKDANERQGEVGSSIVLTNSDKDNFFNEEKTKKYIYVSDNSNSVSIDKDGNSVVTVKFHEAANYNYTINAVAGGVTLEKIASGADFEGETVKVPYHKYVLKDNVLYMAPQGNKDDGYYQKVVSLDQNELVVNVEYSAADLKNVAFWSEAEDIAGLTSNATGAAPLRCSDGKGAFAESDAVIAKLSAGIYRMHVGVFGNTGTNFVFKNGDNVVFKAATTGTGSEVSSSLFELTDDSDIVLSAAGNGGSSPKLLDYVIIEKFIGDDVAVSAIKFATYVPTCNVVVPAEAKVYTAKVNEDKSAVVLTEVPAGSVIAKGTPVLVGAEAGSYNFAASADEATTVADNDLKAAAADTKGDGATIYALVEQDGKAVFAPLKEGVAVSLGHAYLKLPAASATRFYSIQFGGETTGINEVNAAAKADGAYYTLQGVKTSKAAKGIYIHNGKKVVIK